MADPWHKRYSRSEVPDGIPLHTPPRTVSDGASEELDLEWRSKWIRIVNLGENAAHVYLSADALAAGTNPWKIPGGVADTRTDTTAVRTIIVQAPSGGGDVEYELEYFATPSAFNDNHPELTETLGFPAYAAGPPVKPGV